MPLTVGYDATAAVRQSAGIGRYTRELLGALARRDDDIAYRVFAWTGGGPVGGTLPPLARGARYRGVPVSDRVVNAIWHRARLPVPVQAVTGPFDLYHSPDFTLPPTMGKPGVLTVHDLAFLARPETAYPTLRHYLESVVPASARRAAHVIAVSEHTRREVIDRLGIPPERVTAVLEGVGPEFTPPRDAERAAALVQSLGIRRPFILSVGTLEPRKNYPRLLNAFALLRQQGLGDLLVIAGREGWLFEPIFERLRALRLEAHVKFVQPNEDELIALYGTCDAFVYPSLYEGFGIPPLEAMACGAPVACSNASSLPELVGRAAVLFDPADDSAISTALGALLTDRELRRRMRSDGPRHAAAFTWDRAAEGTVEIYRRVAQIG